MQESFLHYIWRYQYFDKKDLVTTDGQSIDVLYPGHYNTDAGPDFKEAKVKIAGIEWLGSVEIHIKSSDWNAHKHQDDPAYNNTILHVVWESEVNVQRADASTLPTLELKNRVDSTLINKYNHLINHPATYVSCENQWSDVAEITKLSMLDKMAMERLYDKSAVVLDLLESNNGNWEETAYQLLFKNFGFKINSDPFLTLAQSLPFKIIKKHAHDLNQIEALLFGMAGFLDEPSDEKSQGLAKEFVYLKQKYALDQKLHKFQWKYLRLRPANFPTSRIAQLAAILHQQPSVFDLLVKSSDLKMISSWLRSKPSDYWVDHHSFAKASKSKNKGLGASSVDNVLINTAVPLKVAYGKQIDNQDFIDQSVELLEQLKAEKNNIIEKWTALGLTVKTAFDSQAAIQLYNSYCKKKRCLICNIGTSLIRLK